jgi:Flp pilus assembly protein TadB
MEAQKRGLDEQVSLSTLELSLISVADAPVDSPDTFASGLATGWDSFVAFLAGALVAIGVMLPWVAFFGVLAAIGLFAARVARRRKQRAAASAG